VELEVEVMDVKETDVLSLTELQTLEEVAVAG
jgi:hypothetical protein